MARGSSERVRVAMIGTGAIGGFFAAKLQEAGHEVTVCVRTPIESLVLEQAGQRRAVPVQIVTDPKVQEPVEWVFVATKAQDTAGAEPWLRVTAGRVPMGLLRGRPGYLAMPPIPGLTSSVACCIHLIRSGVYRPRLVR